MKIENITLYKDNNWLAQIVITEDGFLGAVTDYGNFAYAWRSFGEKTIENFKSFILGLNSEYVSGKIVSQLSYWGNINQKFEKSIHRSIDVILPVLKDYIRDNQDSKDKE